MARMPVPVGLPGGGYGRMAGHLAGMGLTQT